METNTALHTSLFKVHPAVTWSAVGLEKQPKLTLPGTTLIPAFEWTPYPQRLILVALFPFRQNGETSSSVSLVPLPPRKS